MTAPPPLPCALFLLLGLGLAGLVHVAWLRSRWSVGLACPLDGSLRVRGRRLLGENKTVRGLMVMPPATAVTFGLLARGRDGLPSWLASGIWSLPPARLASVGFVVGLAFMLAELPNSFFKRQLGVAPGASPRTARMRWVCLVIDRSDSTLGVLVALGMMLPLHPLTCVWALLFGGGLHWLFSVLLYHLRLKPRRS